MTSSHPTIEISQADDQWTLKTSSLMSTTSYTFKLGEEYEETMKGGRTLKVSILISLIILNSYLIQGFFLPQCVTTMEEGKIMTNCVSDQGKSTRVYEFNDEGFVMVRLKISK